MGGSLVSIWLSRLGCVCEYAQENVVKLSFDLSPFTGKEYHCFSYAIKCFCWRGKFTKWQRIDKSVINWGNLLMDKSKLWIQAISKWRGMDDITYKQSWHFPLLSALINIWMEKSVGVIFQWETFWTQWVRYGKKYVGSSTSKSRGKCRHKCLHILKIVCSSPE